MSKEEQRWSEAPLSELVDHILNEHHTYLRRELPRLTDLLDGLLEAHGAKHPELLECRNVFSSLRNEIESHMAKEEQVLFPMIRDLDGASTLPDFHCGTLQNPIRVMEHEHEGALGALSRLRELTNDYSPPDGASELHRTALSGLAALEADVHQHIHKEDDILFPRTVAAEDSLKPQS
jgi:regulator of cell morphogenesis and NO signaling